MVMLSKTQHSLKAYFPILVTLSGITIFVKPLQPLKAYSPILVTLFGISIFVKLLQPENADDPIVVALVIITSFKFFGIYVLLEEALAAPKIYPKLL